MEIHRRYRGSTLFLLRLWTGDANDETADIEWRGTVRRVVDGEAREFKSLQELVESLQAMISNNKRR
jgi:hypothetical protein